MRDGMMTDRGWAMGGTKGRLELANEKKKGGLVSPVPFPDGVMAGFAGDFTKAYSAVLESPPHFFYFAALASLGSAVAGKVTVESALDVDTGGYWVFLGESSDARKSEAIKQTVKFFREAMGPDFRCSLGAGSAEGLQKELERVGGRGLLMHYDEFKRLVDKCKIEGSVLLPMVVELFEGREYENATKKTNIKIKDAHLSMIAACTLETWNQIWDGRFTAIGFTNRLFSVVGNSKRKHSIPLPVSEEKKEELRAKLACICNIVVGDGVVCGIEPDARKLYDDWYMKLENSIHAKRLETYALRLMPLLSINESRDVIDADIVTKATKLCDWELKVRKLYDPIDADNKYAHTEENMRRWLKKGEGEPMTERDLKKCVNYQRIGSFVYEQAKKSLLKTGEIKSLLGKKLAYNTEYDG
jgi:hypothetical protein